MNVKLNVFNEEKMGVMKTINTLMLIMILSGIFGFIYETIFYRIDLGYFVKRGSSFGPWIPIYAYGGVIITILTYKRKKHPLLILISSCAIAGIMEYLTGYILYEYFNIRLWDYNTEIWNFGNIGGYICLRSILFFGLSSLFLVYVMIPNLIKITNKINDRKITKISVTLVIIYIIDIVCYQIFK